MKPRIKLAETIMQNGACMALYEHDKSFSISLNGKELMNSKVTASESLLGEVGIEHINKDFSPIDDMRASRNYRLSVAKNLLLKAFHEINNKKIIRIN